MLTNAWIPLLMVLLAWIITISMIVVVVLSVARWDITKAESKPSPRRDAR